MNNQKQVEILNDLLTKCYDAEKGYEEARVLVQDPRLMNLFADISRQRYDFGHELKSMIERLGGKIDKGGSFAATIHRAIMDIKSRASDNLEKQVLDEVVRGEENALKHYREAKEKLKPGTDVHTLIAAQLRKIEEMEEKMEALENVFA